MSVTDLILKGSKPLSNESDFSSAFEKSKHVWNSSVQNESQSQEIIQEDDTNDAEDNNAEDSEQNLQDDRTIFVGNLPTKLGIKGLKKALKSLFSKHGAIESMRFRGVGIADPKLSKKVNFITQNFHERRDTMIAYIKFKSEDSVEQALKENNTVLKATDLDTDGNATVIAKHIRVDRADSSAKNNTDNSVFLGNLPYGITEEEIRNHFSSCGNIQCVRIVRDSETGMGKGFGFITFEESGSTYLALELHETQLSGTNRTIRVSLCENKPKVESKRNRTSDKTNKTPNKRQKTLFGNSNTTRKNNAPPVWSGKQAKEGDLSSKAIKRKAKKKIKKQ